MRAPVDAILEQRGIPPRIRRYLTSRYFPESWARLFLCVQLAGGTLLFASFLVGPALALALTARLAGSSVLFAPPPTFLSVTALLLTMFLPALATLPLVDAMVSRLPDRLRLYVRFRQLGTAHGSWIAPPRLADTGGRPEAYIERCHAVGRRKLWIVAAVAAVVTTGLWTVSCPDRIATTDSGLERHGVLESEHISWEQVDAVEVGCASVCQRDTVRYDLRFDQESGGEVLPALRGCPDLAQLEALQALDQRIRAHGVPRSRALHETGQPFHDEGCVERVATRTTFDRAALERIVALE